jgi:hypothetical protein
VLSPHPKQHHKFGSSAWALRAAGLDMWLRLSRAQAGDVIRRAVDLLCGPAIGSWTQLPCALAGLALC